MQKMFRKENNIIKKKSNKFIQRTTTSVRIKKEYGMTHTEEVIKL